MPAPDPDAIHDYDPETGQLWYTYRTPAQMECNDWNGHTLGTNEKRNRDARVRRIAMQIKQDGWLCRHCGREIGFDKRADAQYCRYSCKKNAQAQRRMARQSDQYAHARASC
jgi:RNA polymerase-binding transcription factor DksA